MKIKPEAKIIIKYIYRRAADEDNEERFQRSRHPHNPRHTDEQKDTKNILDTWQIDSKNCS